MKVSRARCRLFSLAFSEISPIPQLKIAELSRQLLNFLAESIGSSSSVYLIILRINQLWTPINSLWADKDCLPRIANSRNWYIYKLSGNVNTIFRMWPVRFIYIYYTYRYLIVYRSIGSDLTVITLDVHVSVTTLLKLYNTQLCVNIWYVRDNSQSTKSKLLKQISKSASSNLM